jgi:hypothetical protein
MDVCGEVIMIKMTGIKLMIAKPNSGSQEFHFISQYRECEHLSTHRNPLFKQSRFISRIQYFPDAAIAPQETERFEIFEWKGLSWFEIDTMVEHRHEFLRVVEWSSPKGFN